MSAIGQGEGVQFSVIGVAYLVGTYSGTCHTCHQPLHFGEELEVGREGQELGNKWFMSQFSPDTEIFF